MADYFFSYPKTIVLTDGKTIDLAIEDNQQRMLITETTWKLEQLYELFTNHGFKPTEGIEFQKGHQIGTGLFKNLTDEWDMHIRFLTLHPNLTAIDAEVEPTRESLEHLQPPKGNWASVIYEVTNILQAVGAPILLFYKRTQSYISRIITNWNLQLKRPDNLTPWKPIIIGGAAAGAIVLALWLLSKK